jgi:predicted PurR-regulated permease PerM
MKETRPRRTGADHEHIEKMSARAAMLLVAVAAVLLHLLQWILLPFVISGLVAYVCTPAIDWLTVRTTIRRAVVAVSVFVVLLLVTSLIGLLGVPSLVREVTRLATDFQGTVEALAHALIGSAKVNLLGEPMTAEQLAQAVAAGARAWVGEAGHIVFAGSAVFVTIFGAFLTLVLLFYFLLNGPAIARGLLRLAPPGQRPPNPTCLVPGRSGAQTLYTRCAWRHRLRDRRGVYGLGLILAIPHAAFLALLTGLLEMIPMIGPGAAAVVAGLVAVRYASGIGPIIGYAVYATALRLSIDQILGPLALGAAARVHPVMVIFCFLAGGALFGIPGLILAMPAALVIRTTLAILYDEPPVVGRNHQ